MDWAAMTAAGREHAALTAQHAADQGTMLRVLDRLRGQLGEPVQFPGWDAFTGPAEALENRTCTLLAPLAERRRRI